MTTVRDIVIENLKRIGAAGLCCKDEECGCSIGDLAPCSGYCLGTCIVNCVPAVEETASESGEFYEKGDRIFRPMVKT